MTRFYSILDVFTEETLGGNPLAVVFDADDMTPEQMQKIAREFNLSETVFVMRAADMAHTAGVRIFTPTSEVPFAGHPTIGTAVALALQSEHALVTLEEGIGPVTCTVSRDGDRKGHAKFVSPKLPQRQDTDIDRETLANALHLDPFDIAEQDRISAWSVGLPFLVVPVRSRVALDRAEPDIGLWRDLFPESGALAGAYLYTDDTRQEDHSFTTRMFAPTKGVPEDPATGSAAAVLPGHLFEDGQIGEGAHHLTLEHGRADGPAIHAVREG